jgi:hypothetical protein
LQASLFDANGAIKGWIVGGDGNDNQIYRKIIDYVIGFYFGPDKFVTYGSKLLNKH